MKEDEEQISIEVIIADTKPAEPINISIADIIRSAERRREAEAKRKEEENDKITE